MSFLSFVLLGSHVLRAHAIPAQITSDFAAIFPAFNGSVSAPGESPSIHCDSQYGEKLDIPDCRNALSQFRTGPEPFVVARRHTYDPGDEEVLPLPYRLMGGK